MIDQSKLPPPLRGAEKGTFTEYTFKKRLPDIARRTAKEAGLSVEAQNRLEALAADLPDGVICPIEDRGAPDVDQWTTWMEPFFGLSWLEAPWFPAETYFFRRILEATGYFQAGPDQGVDPYHRQKEAGLAEVTAHIAPLYERLRGCKDLAPTLKELLHTVIWGNQADLSIWPAGEESPTRHTGDERSAHLVIDHATLAVQYLLDNSARPGRVDFLLDNVGLELTYDLLLADFLLTNQLAGEVRFHAKPYPTYVSDARIPDVWDMVNTLDQAHEGGAVELGRRLWAHLATQKLLLQADSYWVSPLAGWEMPAELRTELSRSFLLISKGDANYRRWLGDRHWNFTEPISKIVSYRPAPLLLLRVLKSDVIAGLREGQAEDLAREDPTWLHDGSRALIQLLL